MTRWSIRIRLTWWYVAVLAVATVILTGASWWLSTQSVVRSADIGLQARVDGVQDFLDNPRTRLTVEGLQDEFGEYAELTRGEALLEVLDSSGTVLVRPSIPGWKDMADREARTATSREIQPVDRLLGESPYRVASARLDAAGGSYRVTVAAPMGPAYAALNRFHRWLLLLLPAILAVAGSGGYWISRRALTPVDEITSAVQAITVQSLDKRLPLPPADDELRRLASTFNDVLARLETAVGDMVRFTANASHELRTPVSLVRTTAELALRHERMPRDYRLALAEVLEHARGMSVLVDDLLVLARTDAGIERPDRELIDLTDVATEAVREVQELARGRSIDVRLETKGPQMIVDADRVSLRRLLFILLDNAVKYSRPGSGTVDVRLSVGSRGPDDRELNAVLEVADSGIGLDAAESPRLFERFFRGARARQHAPEGTGLGLPIARTMVEGLGGTINLVNHNDGPGCSVIVRLPAHVINAARSFGSSTSDPIEHAWG